MLDRGIVGVTELGRSCLILRCIPAQEALRSELPCGLVERADYYRQLTIVPGRANDTVILIVLGSVRARIGRAAQHISREVLLVGEHLKVGGSPAMLLPIG